MGRQASVGWAKQAILEQNVSISFTRSHWQLLHYFKQVDNLSVTCFHVELEQFLACFRDAGLSATAGLSCFCCSASWNRFRLLLQLHQLRIRRFNGALQTKDAEVKVLYNYDQGNPGADMILQHLGDSHLSDKPVFVDEGNRRSIISDSWEDESGSKSPLDIA